MTQILFLSPSTPKIGSEDCLTFPTRRMSFSCLYMFTVLKPSSSRCGRSPGLSKWDVGSSRRFWGEQNQQRIQTHENPPELSLYWKQHISELVSQSNLAPLQYKLCGHVCDSIFHLPQMVRGVGSEQSPWGNQARRSSQHFICQGPHEQGPSVTFFIGRP